MGRCLIDRVSAGTDPSIRLACQLRPVADLSFVGQSLDRVLEPGRFEIHVGQSADAANLLSAAIELAS